MYASSSEEKLSNFNDYSGFNSKISEIIRNSVKPVLDNCNFKNLNLNLNTVFFFNFFKVIKNNLF